jgi:hypothetical protein
MMREYQVRFCEGLGVKFPGPTRQKRLLHRQQLYQHARYAHRLGDIGWV